MTLTLDLPPGLEERLATEAMRAGLAVEEYAIRLLGWPTLPTGGPEERCRVRRLLASRGSHGL